MPAPTMSGTRLNQAAGRSSGPRSKRTGSAMVSPFLVAPDLQGAHSIGDGRSWSREATDEGGSAHAMTRRAKEHRRSRLRRTAARWDAFAPVRHLADAKVG
jgi:hypothetical protein